VRKQRFQGLDGSRYEDRGDADLLAAAKAREEARWRKARSIGIIGTVLLHLLLLLLIRPFELPPPYTSPAAGPAAGDIRPAGGGSGMTMVDVRPERPPPPAEQIPVPVPVPVPREVVPIPEPVETPSPRPDPGPAPAPSAPGTGGPGTGGQDGPATGPGTSTGTGDGGGGDGAGGPPPIIPPTPRGVFIPPSGRPASARGQEITVWVFVTDRGRVERNSIRLEPPTSDSRYNQRLIQSVAEWVFDPARQGGRPVPVWYSYQIIL
jgi:periplasmic protein TonB